MDPQEKVEREGEGRGSDTRREGGGRGYLQSPLREVVPCVSPFSSALCPRSAVTIHHVTSFPHLLVCLLGLSPTRHIVPLQSCNLFNPQRLTPSVSLYVSHCPTSFTLPHPITHLSQTSSHTISHSLLSSPSFVSSISCSCAVPPSILPCNGLPSSPPPIPSSPLSPAARRSLTSHRASRRARPG